MALTFEQLRAANVSRAKRWHQGTEWDFGKWLTGFIGEVGEACNIQKKLNRLEDGFEHYKQEAPPEELRAKLGEELADAMIYLDLLAENAGVDLETEVRKKFNAVSDMAGFPEKL